MCCIMYICMYAYTQYSCMIRHPRFYTAFFEDCTVGEDGLDLGVVGLDPILNPGDRALEVEWNAAPNALNQRWGDAFA